MLYNKDCIEVLKTLDDNSINCVLTDPPYLYLKNQKLEREFDENGYFNQIKRVLKDDGFIILFGRGSSFYRWNTILDNLDFKFKEEIVWNKNYISSPVLPLSRVHETVSIHTKGNGIIKKVKIPYVEMKKHLPIQSIIQDINRISAILNNEEILEKVKKYLEFQDVGNKQRVVKNFNTTVTDSILNIDRVIFTLKSIEGMSEKSIITELRDHYNTIHPTQKPVKLFERLLNLTTNEKDIVIDTFMGSGVCAIASYNLNREFIGCEIDEEYFTKAKNRIEQHKKQNIKFKELF